MRSAPIAMLLALAVPGVAHAKTLRVTSYQIDEAVGVVELEADHSVGAPWFHIHHHEVRIWFPDTEDVTRFDQGGDPGEGILAVHLRAGADDTAMLRVELGEGRRLAPDAISITRNGTHVAVRVKLPPLNVSPASSSHSAARNRNAASAREASEQPPVTSPALTPIASAAAAPSIQAAPVQPRAAPVGATTPLRSAAKQPAKTHGLAGDSVALTTRTMLLLIASIALAGIYGIVRLASARSAVASRPQIEVIGAKRLGHGHQLILVRALGEDHLLSCNGGRTERLASAPTPTAGAGGDEVARSPSGRGQGFGLLSALSSKRRIGLLLDEVDSEVPAAPKQKPKQQEEVPPFGAELLNFVRSQSLRPALAHMRVSAGKKESEAVAGIARLRDRATS